MTQICGRANPVGEGRCHRPDVHHGPCVYGAAAPAADPSAPVTPAPAELLPVQAARAYREATLKLHALEEQHVAAKRDWQEALAALNRALIEG